MPCVMADHDDGDVELQILYLSTFLPFPQILSYSLQAQAVGSN